MPRTAVNPGSRPRSPRRAVAEHAMEMQAQLRRTATAVGEAAMQTGNWTLMAEAHALRRLALATAREAKRVAGLADEVVCADGVNEPGHGKVA